MPDSDEQEQAVDRLITDMVMFLEQHRSHLNNVRHGEVTLEFIDGHITGRILIKGLRLTPVVKKFVKAA